jgi:predicted PurR-regulated permease PerM
MTAGRRTVATVAIIGLGLAIGAAVLPFLFGLLGAPILAVTFSPFHRWLRERTGPRRAAACVVVAAVIAIFLPAIGISLLLVSELPAVLTSPDLARIIGALGRLHLGPFDFGKALAAASSDFTAWLSRQAVALIGGLTFVAVNLLIAFLGLYFLLRANGEPWLLARRYIPFSVETTDRLRSRFHDLTRATILGIGATAVVQGLVVAGGFALVGLGHPLLWGAITGVASVLPVFGSAIVWLPGAAFLVLEQRYADAAILTTIGVLIASNVDNVIRPMIFRRVGAVHPLVAVVGAFAGMRYFGLLGLLLGPLALVYFIELVQAYDADFRRAVPGMGIRPTTERRLPDSRPGSPNASFSHV